MTATTSTDAVRQFAYRQPIYALDDTEGMRDALHRDGYALIPGVLDADEVAAAREAADRLEPFGFDHRKELNDHFKCVFNRERLWLSYADRPGVVDLAERVMGEQCHIIGMSAWRTRPGYNGWGVHVDQIFVPVPEEVLASPDYELPILVCTAHYYLSDITEDLAPTHVVTGSHRAGRGPQRGESDWNGRAPEPVLCRAGDVLFFRSELWHTGSANRTADESRYLLQVHYADRNVAQKFSPWPWQYNPEILAVANDRQLRLLGRHPEGNYG